MQMVIIIKKAKNLVKAGYTDDHGFKEVEVAEVASSCPPSSSCNIELIWQNNVIRFDSSDLLLDFLKKAA